MKVDVYQAVTDRLVSLLEQGVVPWRSPYLAKVGIPRNFVSKKPYRGINVFLLSTCRFTSPWFLTFIQAKELGGHVRKGEKGFLVVKYGTFEKEVENGETGEAEEKKLGYLKTYTVFNASQIEGIEFPIQEPLPTFTDSDASELARQIIAGMPKRPEIKEGFTIPSYVPALDVVQMPEPRYFDQETAYFSTLFHELAHSTGAASRLARKSLLDNKGMFAAENQARKVYAEEELVAEMAASFLNAHAGIIEAEIDNAAAYLAGWLKVLKSNDAKGWIIRAAAQAQKAADFVLGIDVGGG
jgi:antirestriction protein ArdC